MPQLVAGEMPPDIEQVFAYLGLALFPADPQRASSGSGTELLDGLPPIQLIVAGRPLTEVLRPAHSLLAATATEADG